MNESKKKLEIGEKSDIKHQEMLIIMCVSTSRFYFRAMIDVKRLYSVCYQLFSVIFFFLTFPYRDLAHPFYNHFLGTFKILMVF